MRIERLFCGLGVLIAASAGAADFSRVPGTVISHIPAAEERYIGSPSIAILPNGDYVATHDEFGPKSSSRTAAITHVFRSADKGNAWTEIARIEGAFWSTLFFHSGALYLMGTTKEGGDLVIRRSNDGGVTWTSPGAAHSGLLAKGKYHCAPVPVVEHNGRLWRAMEDEGGPDGWGSCFRAFMMSIPLDANLLEAANWTFSNRIGRDPAWLEGKFRGWLEGNAVVTPGGEIVDILRVDTGMEKEWAAIIRISPDGTRASFEPAKDFVPFPGGAKKFTIRWDPRTKRYWALSNAVPRKYRGPEPAKIRNTQALISSRDLRHWKIERIVLEHPDKLRSGFQYIDWLFEDANIIAACRTAYEDGLGGAHNPHDANFLTFHRIPFAK